MTLEFINHSKTRIPKSFLQKWVKYCQREIIKAKKSHGPALNKQLVVIFLEEKSARKLNLQFRKKNYATDVLSFDNEEPEVLGELVLCPQVLKKQAQQNNHSYRNECAYIILHGILHLLGYEHENSDKKAKKMYALQDKIFKNINKI